MSLQLPAILSPPTPCIPLLALTVLAASSGRPSRLALHGSASVSGLRLSLAGSPLHQAVSCSTWSCLWTGSSSPIALHPVSRQRSFLRLRTASALSDGDFHPRLACTLRRTRAVRPGPPVPSPSFLFSSVRDHCPDQLCVFCVAKQKLFMRTNVG